MSNVNNSATGLGLSNISNLSELLDDTADNGGAWIEMPIEKIVEDPDQPRTAKNPGFSKGSIAELAATIGERGVKTPISVRPHPDSEGMFIINHGARRYRASIVAGKKTIPAWIDSDYSEADQVIENLQRNDLTAREIADYLGRELAKGKKKGELAKEIGKSASFVSQHVTLLDLPAPIADVFSSDRAKDVTVINDLVKLFKRYPEEVEAWLSDDSQELTRSSVRLLKEYLDAKKEEPDNAGSADEPDNAGSAAEPDNAGSADEPDDAGSAEEPDDAGSAEEPDDAGSAEEPDDAGSAEEPDDAGSAEEPDDAGSAEEPDDAGSAEEPDDAGSAEEPDDAGSAEEATNQDASGTDRDPNTLDAFDDTDESDDDTGVAVLVEHDSRSAELLVHRMPSEEGLGWIRYDDNRAVQEVQLSEIKVLAILDV